MEIDRCTHQDFLDILTDLEDFWGSDRARAVHHPMFLHEFGDTAWVVREDDRVVAYLFGFWSQTEPIGCIHLVGVRRSHQRRGIGRLLYERFEERARERGCTGLKALTPPINLRSDRPCGQPSCETSAPSSTAICWRITASSCGRCSIGTAATRSTLRGMPSSWHSIGPARPLGRRLISSATLPITFGRKGESLAFAWASIPGTGVS